VAWRGGGVADPPAVGYSVVTWWCHTHPRRSILSEALNGRKYSCICLYAMLPAVLLHAPTICHRAFMLQGGLPHAHQATTSRCLRVPERDLYAAIRCNENHHAWHTSLQGLARSLPCMVPWASPALNRMSPMAPLITFQVQAAAPQSSRKRQRAAAVDSRRNIRLEALFSPHTSPYTITKINLDSVFLLLLKYVCHRHLRFVPAAVDRTPVQVHC
jgi:hypothetical protein